MSFLEPIEFWHWWALGGVLVILEVFAPGFVLLWLGASAGLVGLLLLLWPSLDLTIQALLFAALSVGSIVAWRHVQTSLPVTTDQPNLNRRGHGHVGRRATLVAPIVNGHGRVKLGDATWAARGPDLPLGHLVEVTGVDGVVLLVRPLESSMPVDGSGPDLPLGASVDEPPQDPAVEQAENTPQPTA